MNDWEGDFVCVDGLQRITACMAFINNEIPVFGSFCSEFDRLPMANVYLSFWVNNLKTRREVLTWYLEMNTGGTIHTDAEISKVRKMMEEEQ